MPAFSPGRIVLASLFASVVMTATPAMAREALDGARLPWPLALPFAGILLSIALGPLAVKEWWHIHYDKAAGFWAILALGGLIAVEGLPAAAASFAQIMVLEYLPFILMLFALFTAAGGITVEGRLNGSAPVNTTILALGTMIASIIGTTGASMILIQPLIRANSTRSFNAHVVVFFIFLVSNIGGVLTPLGDPPLFLGFLRGIDFFWTTRALWPQALFASGVLLAIFFFVDLYFDRHEASPPPAGTTAVKLRVSGQVNIGLIGIAILAVVASGFWRPGIGFDLLGTRIELQNLIRELIMVVVGLASLRVTNPGLRAANGFEWEPIREVAYLFAGIFTCIIPVMAMLEAGAKGPFSAAIDRPGTGRNARQRGLFLGDGHPLVVPRQCADISCVFSARRRRPRGAHGSARQDIDRDFARRGVHGRQHLHRQCA